MIRIKNTHKCRQKLTKISILDSMKFMRTGELLGENKESREIVGEQSESEEIIINRGEGIEVAIFFENKNVKSRVIYHVKKKSEQDQRANKKLPMFFRQIQKVSKHQLQQVKMQNKQKLQMQNLLLKDNEPFRQSYQ